MKMTCPKCRIMQDKNDECAHCGVIVNNYGAYLSAKLLNKEEEYREFKRKVDTYPLSNIYSPTSMWMRSFVLSIVLYFSYFYVNSKLDSLHGVNTIMNYIFLPLHDGGHALASMFITEDGGLFSMISALSASVLQVIVFIMFMIIFKYKSKNSFLEAMSLWLLAGSLSNISLYINEARVQDYTLLSYDFDSFYGKNDWFVILDFFKALQFDHFIANILLDISHFMVIVSVLYMIYLIYKQKSLLSTLKSKKEELKNM